LATADHIPEADLFLPGSVAEILPQARIHKNTYITVLTRNVLLDRELLPLLVATKTPYIGVIGSQRRWQETKKLLLEDGMAEEDLQRIHSPIGLELNAQTPEEIAVSILSEIIMLRRGGTGKRLVGKQHSKGSTTQLENE
jgi:xanthine dehydrogenase accessory factor